MENENKEKSIEKKRPKKNKKKLIDKLKNNEMYYIFGEKIISVENKM